jgi:hypothetical protein
MKLLAKLGLSVLILASAGVLLYPVLQDSYAIANAPMTISGDPPPKAVSAATPSNAVLTCDRGAAVVVSESLQHMARTSDYGDGITRYDWGAALDNASDDRRLRLVRAAADSDACLTGVAREQRHFLNGRFFAVASPRSGVRLLD